MGKFIGGMTFIGGAIIIKSLLTPEINMPVLLVGLVILVIAFIMFIKEILKI